MSNQLIDLFRLAVVVCAWGGLCGSILAQSLSVNPGAITLDGGIKDLKVQNLTAAPIVVNTLQLNVQVTTVPGGAVRPKLTNVELLSGTFFSSEPAIGLSGGSTGDYSWEIGFNDDGSAPHPTIPANGEVVFGRLTFDSTGIAPGSWGLSFTIAGASSSFLDTGIEIPTTWTDGSISVVPEPSTYTTIFALGSLAFAACRRRRGV